MRWYAGKVLCCLCTETWIGVWPEVAPEAELQCPACDKAFSEVLEYFGPEEKEEVVSALEGAGLVEYREEE